jgi:hypothetical protein
VLPNLISLALNAVSAQDVGRASATLSTARQLGSVFGIAVPVAIFQLAGSLGSPADIVDGTTAALIAGAISAAAGAFLALPVIPRVRAKLALARA